jgi:hypothetical protein
MPSCAACTAAPVLVPSQRAVSDGHDLLLPKPVELTSPSNPIAAISALTRINLATPLLLRIFTSVPSMADFMPA